MFTPIGKSLGFFSLNGLPSWLTGALRTWRSFDPLILISPFFCKFFPSGERRRARAYGLFFDLFLQVCEGEWRFGQRKQPNLTEGHEVLLEFDHSKWIWKSKLNGLFKGFLLIHPLRKLNSASTALTLDHASSTLILAHCPLDWN